MAEFTDYLENKILNHIFTPTAYASPNATVHLALFTTVCSDSARGTEVTGSGYARQLVAFSAAVGGTISNSAVESFTATGGNFGTVVCTGLEDAASAGNQLCFDNDFTDTQVNDADTLQFAIGDIDVTLT